MSGFARIRTTIPPRTLGAGQKSMAPNAILLRMSFLESERQRRMQEIELLHARTIRLRTRIEEIDREKEMMRRTLESAAEPLSSPRAVPVSRAASPARTGGRFAFRY